MMERELEEVVRENYKLKKMNYEREVKVRSA